VAADTGGQRGNDCRVELATLDGLLKDLHGRVGRHRRAIGARDPERLVAVGDRDDAHLERDLRRLEAVRVSAAVEVLVVRADDRQEPRERRNGASSSWPRTGCCSICAARRR